MSTLNHELLKACTECKWDGEEEGGIIVQKGDDFLFTKLTNENTGSPIAAGLYTVDRKEYGEKIIKLFNDGWINYASFHTHPDGCPARASTIDLSKLFKGFQRNYIFSPWNKDLTLYTKLSCVPEVLNTLQWPTIVMYDDGIDEIRWVKSKITL